MLLDTMDTTLARGLLMLSPTPRLMLIPLFFMDLIMADMVWGMLDMLDLAMDIPMLLDTMDTTLARGLLMLSLRPRRMLIPLFFMDPIMADMVWVMLDMLDLAMDILMLLDTMDTTLARGLLMLSPRPRLMLIP